MKKNMSKFAICTLLMSIMVAGAPAQSFAMDSMNQEETNSVSSNEKFNEPMKRTVNVSTSYEIEKVGKPSVKSDGPWIKYYDGANSPCRRDGETVTAGTSVTYSHTYSGTLMFPLKGPIQASVGYSFGEDESFSISKTSAPLKKGEFVRCYYKKTYEVTPVTQKKIIRRTGFETKNGVTYPVNEVKSETAVVNCKKALMPSIDIRYSKQTRVNGVQKEVLVAKETYELRGNRYVLVNKETF